MYAWTFSLVFWYSKRVVSRCLFFWGNTWIVAYALFQHFPLEPSGQRLKSRCYVQLWAALVMIWTISAPSLKNAQCKFKPTDLSAGMLFLTGLQYVCIFFFFITQRWILSSDSEGVDDLSIKAALTFCWLQSKHVPRNYKGIKNFDGSLFIRSKEILVKKKK